MLSRDDLDLLEAIRSAGSLSRAAARLGKAPSTISYAARQLEERFDALLFDRRRYRMALTPAGALLAEEAARIGADAERLERRVRQIAGGWEEQLRIHVDEILDFAPLREIIPAFDALGSNVALRFGYEVLNGTWEALADGRADLVIGSTNEAPTIAGLQWKELGVIDWVFAVARLHPLATIKTPLTREQRLAYRAVVVADTSRASAGKRSYGIQGGQPVLAMPSMRDKIEAQCAGLGVGWLPRKRVAALLASGQLVEKATEDPREANTLYVAWVGRSGEQRALRWWLEQLDQPRLRERLLHGLPL